MTELAAERSVVKEALRELLIETFVFEEDAGARETSIERTFVDELSAADLYVGLFWKGYGEFTIQEFQTGGELGIDRLIFEKRVDLTERDTRLQSFLDEISHVHSGITIRWFESLVQLKQRVKEDVARWLAEIVRKNRHRAGRGGENSMAVAPDRLPCLCDRGPQEQEFKNSLVPHLLQKQRRPLVVVLHGHVQEGHRYYIDRVEARSVLESLTLAAMRGQRKLIRINEAIDANQSQADFSVRLRIVLAQKLQVAYSGDDQFLIDYARSQQVKVLIAVLSILASEQARMHGNPLEKTCEYLAIFPDLPEGILLSFIVCIQYEGEQQRRAPGFLGRFLRPGLGSTTFNGNAALQSELQRCHKQYDHDPRIRFVELPILDSPTPADVMRWCEDEYVRRYVRFIPRREIYELFEGRKSLPMEELYEKLLVFVTNTP
jgi:hypothetical protein